MNRPHWIFRSLREPHRTLCDDSGATSIEYALIAGLMALVCAEASTRLGVVVEAFYTVTATLVNAAV